VCVSDGWGEQGSETENCPSTEQSLKNAPVPAVRLHAARCVGQYAAIKSPFDHGLKGVVQTEATVLRHVNAGKAFSLASVWRSSPCLPFPKHGPWCETPCAGLGIAAAQAVEKVSARVSGRWVRACTRGRNGKIKHQLNAQERGAYPLSAGRCVGQRLDANSMH